MKIRFLMHDLYGPGGGVLKVVLSLAEDLGARHDVELVSVLRRREEPVHRLPDNVSVRSIADLRRSATSRGGPVGRVRDWALRQPSRLVPSDERRHQQHSLYSDALLARYLRSVKDGVIVAMQPAVSVPLARLGHPGAVRIAQEHRPFVSRRKGLQEELARYYPRLDMFLTLTERDARKYRKALGGNVPVRVMPNGTPIHHGATSTQDNKVVVAAGRLGRSKGYDRLLDAWATVVERHPDWQLRIFGEGSERDNLAKQIARLGLTESARLMGYSSRLGDDMAQASLFVLSSRAEGYPMVLLEAMSCGLPVVSFDCPTGPREIITPGEDGMLVRNGDVPGLAEAICQVIEMGQGRRSMAQAALQTAAERTQSAITARWEELFTELLATKRPGKRAAG